MRILLIRPPEPRTAKSGSVLHPLGLAYIAAMLEKHDFQVDIFDCQAYHNSWGTERVWETLTDRIDSYKPDVVGISCKTTFYSEGVAVASLVKGLVPQVLVIAGGPHITAFPSQTLQESPAIDVAVYGEGEHTMVELCHAVLDHKKLGGVQGLVFRHNGELVDNGPRPLWPHLDDIPFPAYHLLPMERYSMATCKKKPFVTMITSRGCPFQCKFCSSRQTHGLKVRRRSTENILAEIRLVQNRYSVKDVAFMDDTFTVNPQSVLEFCDSLSAEQIDIGWQCQTRVSPVTEDILHRMKRSGCYMVNYGVEFGSQRVLDLSGKGITLLEVRRAFALTKRVGIRTYAYFMLGWPGETKADAEETIRLAKELEPDFAQFSIVVPFPGSPLFETCVEKGLVQSGRWQEFDYAYNPIIETAQLDAEDLKRLYGKAYREFYFRPRYLLRRLLSLRSLDEMKAALAGLWSFLRFLIDYSTADRAPSQKR